VLDGFEIGCDNGGRFPLRLNRISKAGGREESRGVIRLLGGCHMARPAAIGPVRRDHFDAVSV
jgi:hypothetical protein